MYVQVINKSIKYKILSQLNPTTRKLVFESENYGWPNGQTVLTKKNGQTVKIS